jgi:hypothetical protein
MPKGSADRDRLVGRRRPGERRDVLEVCERHETEERRKCEGLVYEATGDEARAISANNATCKECGRPMARILDAIAGTETGACDFCFGLKRRVAVSRSAFLAVPLKICAACASDAHTALSLEASADDDDPDDE